MPPVPLPVLSPAPGAPLRITPTDVSQFIRLEQCERFLRFRLAERARQRFMRDYGVSAQRITPLLSLSGRSFEEGVEKDLRQRFRWVHYAEAAHLAHDRPADNADVLRQVCELRPGDVVLLFQARLQGVLDGWLIRGDVDLLRLERRAGGLLHALIVDLKSTTAVKVEHRLQVALYQMLLGRLLHRGGQGAAEVQTAVLYRPPASPTPEEEEEMASLKEAARRWFGLEGVLLEVVADPDAYLHSARDLVTGPESTARRVAGTPFDEIPFCLSYKCDGCLYNEWCMKSAAEQGDLSLLPYLSGIEKEALKRAGVGTVEALARLKDLSPSGELTPAAGQEGTASRLAVTWPVGPRLDELIHRAKQSQRGAGKDTPALPYIPGKGHSTLPASTEALNPNLIVVHVEAHNDYLNDRVWCLSALVVAHQKGQALPDRRRVVLHMTDRPPIEASQERALFVAWTRDLVQAVAEAAAPEREAPIHFVFFDRHEQRLMLQGLARCFPPVLQENPPLYDLLTQLGGLDSPIATFLSEEVRESKNFPLTCPNLHALASYLRFDWNAPRPFRELFRARLFDSAGKLPGESGAWYTKRARFGSSLPLEYAYAAWGELPPVKAGQGDPFADFRHVTPELLRDFQVRRLESVAHVASRLTPNPHVEKKPFRLPDLARYEDRATDLAEALREFVVLERHAALAEWTATRHAPPERRVLMGETLLVRYVAADQEQPAGPPTEGTRVRLRLEAAGLDCDVNEVLALTTLRAGERVVLHPRWVVDERLPPAERKPYTPTPRQLLYGTRAALLRVVTDKDGERVRSATIEVELKEGYGGAWSRGFVFPSVSRPLEDGALYTLDPCPNDWYGYWCSQVVEGLCAGRPNRLYDLLADPGSWGSDGAPLPGQARFLAGLLAFGAQGLLHDFEESKRTFIGGYGTAPVVLVQGPPGTGKSYGTAFALFARLQGAMQEGADCRAFVSCKTHAATDVMMRNVLEVRRTLADLRVAAPAVFDRYFDPRLLEVPLFRVTPHDPPPEEVVLLTKDGGNAEVIEAARWCVVGATPGGVYGLVKERWGSRDLFGHELCDVLVLDEASQMSLPEALLAALPLKADGAVVVVGDHRQMPPIVRHDWKGESRRTFQQYEVFLSLFDTLRQCGPPLIQFAESFRLHSAMAEFLRQEVYRHDGIAYFSRKGDELPAREVADPMVAAALRPEYPLVVVVHDEAGSQVRNAYEQALIEPVLRELSAPQGYGLEAEEGLGVVVPHRAQRSALQQAFPALCILDPASGLAARSAIDTVERFQGGERTVVVVSATESDPAYLLAAGEFLLDRRRLTVALSRAKRKLVLVASRAIFGLFSPDEEAFANSQLWKNLLRRTCTVKLWEGERGGRRVQVWGGPAGP